MSKEQILSKLLDIPVEELPERDVKVIEPKGDLTLERVATIELESLERFPGTVVTEPETLYIISSWNSRHVVKTGSGDAREFELIEKESCGAPLKIGEKYLVVRPKY